MIGGVRVILKLLPLAALVAVMGASPAYARLADHNPIEVTDPPGDSGGAADITRVTVANDLSGKILFVVQVGNRSGFVANDIVAIFIDSDKNPATGSPNTGSDYFIGFDATVPAVGLAKWNGTTFEDVATTSLRGAWSAGYLALIDRAELGNTTAFDFQVITALTTSDQHDVSPDGDFQTFAVAPPHIASIAPGFSTLKPRAATTFRLKTVQLTLETDETAAAGSFSCKAKLAGKRLKGTGPGGCTFKLPKTAKGKKLSVTITAAPAGGKAQTFAPYVFTVR
jgi:hypothetical protein